MDWPGNIHTPPAVSPVHVHVHDLPVLFKFNLTLTFPLTTQICPQSIKECQKLTWHAKNPQKPYVTHKIQRNS